MPVKNLEIQPVHERLDALLIYPIWVTATGRGRLQRMLPPLGILSIASYLESLHYKVAVMDLHGDPMMPEEFRRRVRELQPKTVGITVLSNHFIVAHHIAAICKEEVPDCRVLVGGVHAEAYPEQMLQNKNIDAVARGDGEETMADFVAGRTYAETMGLSYRGPHNDVIHNPIRALTKDLDQYPFPAYHLIDFSKYFPGVGTYRNYPAINALMTRGCPGKCTFCNSANTVLRGRSPKKMVDLIEHLRKDHGIRQVTFYDDTFTATPITVREFCHEMIKRKVDVTFVCYARGDMFSEEMAGLLAKAGCHQVLLGIESGSQKLMAAIGKPIEKAKYKRVVDIAHQVGIEVRGAFIIGHLEETMETLEETLQFAIDLDLDFFAPSILTPYPGTALYKQAKAENILLHEDYSRYGQGEVILKMKNLSTEELLHFYKWCFFRFYLRPHIFLKQLKRLKTLRQFLDIFSVFRVLVLEGLGKNASESLLAWIHFDLEKVIDRQVIVPAESRLTWEVRNMDSVRNAASM
jgi:anaerobic magnesium-protoporphyrin IX monomethyl ester cyclase